MGKIAAILNAKGGVGKTTVTLGLASAAQAAGVSTLVVDLDPQGSATWALRPDLGRGELVTIGDALADGSVGAAAAAVRASGWGPGVDVIAATPALVEREADRPRREPHLRLARVLEGVSDGHDLVLFDCAPTLGRVTTWGLAACDAALLVTEPSALSARGLDVVDDRLAELSEELGRPVPVAGVVVNRVPGRGNEASRQLARIRSAVGVRSLWEPFVPSRVALNEALSDGTPIHWWGARGAEAAEAFDALLARLRRSLARR